MDNQTEQIFPNQPVVNPVNQAPQPLPNSTTVLVLGILSIVICCVGLILGIIALVLSGKDRKLYAQNPGKYTLSSFNNLNAGRICAIIGVILSSLSVLYYIVLLIWIFIVGAAASTMPFSNF